MKELCYLLRPFLFALGLLTLAACGRGDDNGGNKNGNSSGSSNWDQMVWDRDNWS